MLRLIKTQLTIDEYKPIVRIKRMEENKTKLKKKVIDEGMNIDFGDFIRREKDMQNEEEKDDLEVDYRDLLIYLRT